MPSVPVLSALTELLSGAVTEEFKKLFKPSALVAAADTIWIENQPGCEWSLQGTPSP